MTQLIHSKEDALDAEAKALAAFSGDVENMPTAEIEGGKGMAVADGLVELKIAKSKGEAKRLIESGAVKINDEKVTDAFAQFSQDDEIKLSKGKKLHLRVFLK